MTFTSNVLSSSEPRLTEQAADITATRGDEAIQIARGSAIDVSIVDLKMPGLNGQDTLEALKKENPWMEIIILTGHGTIDSAAACTRSGADSYQLKPRDLNQLLSTLAEAYKKRWPILSRLRKKE